MVFTERTGLDNLYSIVNYSTDKKSCKRNLVADHFKDHQWKQIGECKQMCDICNESVEPVEVNCKSEANIIFKILEKHSGKDKRLTANKLAELAGTEIAKSKESLNNLGKRQTEHLILELLKEQFLREEFSYTPYSTICYIVKGGRNLVKDSFNLFLQDIKPQEQIKEKSNKKTIIKKKKPVAKQSNNEILIDDSIEYSCKRKNDNDIVILDSSDEEFTTKKHRI